MNVITKLKILKKIRPDKEWSFLTMDEIMKTKIFPQPTLLQKVKIFVNLHNSFLKTFVVSAAMTTAVLVLGSGAFIQPEQNNLLLDSNTQAKINSILTEREKINSLIKVEVNEGRVTEENEDLVGLLRQRHSNRLELQLIISGEIDGIKTRHKKELTDQDIDLLLLAQRANDAENFHLALFVLENIRD